MTDEVKDGPPMITLGGVKYPIGEFTVGDQERLQPLFAAMGDDTYASSQARTTIIWIGLKAADPVKWAEIATLRDLKGVKQPELMAALRVVCIASGLNWKEKKAPDADTAPGEAKPVTEPAPAISQDGTGLQGEQS